MGVAMSSRAATRGPNVPAVRKRPGRRRGWIAAVHTLGNRLIAAAVIAGAVLIVCAVLLYLAERDRNPNMKGLLSGYSYVGRALLEGSTPWPLKTPQGRVVHEVILLIGRSAVALATGVVASRLVEMVMKRGAGMEDVKHRDHIVICGWSSKGPEILRELHAKEVDDTRAVVVLAPLAASPTRDEYVTFVNGNPTNEEDLERAGIKAAATAIILADDTRESDTDDDVDARTLLTCLAVESLNPDCYTCVEVVSSRNRHHFLRTKADELVVSAELTGALLASSAKTHGLSRFITDLVTHPDGHEFYTVPAPIGLVGRSVADALTYLKDRHDCLLVALAPTDGGYIVNPPADTVINADERLLVIATGPPAIA